jgi:diaminopimelate decarboxylase
MRSAMNISLTFTRFPKSVNLSSIMPTETAIASGLDCAPPLTAKLAPWISRFIGQPALGQSLLDTYGSPLHVVVSSEFRRNVTDLLSPYQARGLSGGLFFARKANKLPWFPPLAQEEGIGVDTASITELRDTLKLGVSPERIIVTAIGKSKQLVTEAVANGCLLVLDNLDELNLTKETARSLGRTARIGLRFSGFTLAGRTIFSRFGFPVDDFGALLEDVCREKAVVKLEILHAHLDRYDTAERAAAARQLIQFSDRAKEAGQRIVGIDLGGGILMRYLDSAAEWQEFQDRLIASVSGKQPTFTYLADGLGYFKVGDEVMGKADLYPAWNHLSKERFISAVLDDDAGGTPLHQEVSRRGLQLFFEPGRALLDNVGVTLSSVMFHKRDTSGNLLIGLAMNRTNLRPFRAEFCSDPFLLTSARGAEAVEGAYLVGNLCSESDLIFRRKLRFAQLPRSGDSLCFVNTAGYLAHHMEIGTHGDPLPANALIDAETFVVSETFAG